MRKTAVKIIVSFFYVISAQNPGIGEGNGVLSPGQDYRVRVGVGQAALVKFSCLSGPADIVVTLRSYSERADPLLFLSLDPEVPPSFGGHDSSTFTHWLEDSAGNHYATAKGLGPEGGMLRLLNMRKFASEELNAQLSLHCSYLIAFDLLFWEHLRSGSICPTGNNMVPAAVVGSVDTSQDRSEFCSGFGRCDKHGECRCDGQHTGPACEHDKLEILHNQNFDFQVPAGHYQYFRVHIPPRFPGGYIKVDVSSSAPVVVLVRYDDLPTKATYDLGNFDDWINRRSHTELKFKVEPLGGAGVPEEDRETGPAAFDGPESFGLGGRPPAVGDGMGDLPPPLPAPEAGAQMEGEAPTLPRRLSSLRSGLNSSRQLAGQREACPEIVSKPTHESCFTPGFLRCEEACMTCLKCAQSEDKQPCSTSCQECLLPQCSQRLAKCASDISCSGPEAQECEAGCGSCWRCMDSTDQRCSLCNCCSSCLPLAAKCMHNGAVETRYVFIGVLHHRRQDGLGRGAISASADIRLVEDETYAGTSSADDSWTAELYNPFQDLRSVEMTHNQEYPGGEQFMYTMDIRQEAVAHLQVRTFRDRMTLLHLRNIQHLHSMQLAFLSGLEISHVLTTSRASPKTLFDFDQAPVQVDKMVRIRAEDQQDIWCAIFGNQDGYAQITVKSDGDADSSGIPPGVAVVLLLVLGFLCTRGGGCTSLSSGFTNLVGRLGKESNASQAAEPLQGYSGSDVIDRTLEDQYLHRGGLGDEGL